MTAGPAVLPPPIVQVRIPEAGWRQDLRAITIVWRRELIRFFRSRTRILTSLMQPILFLFVLGTGLSPVVAGGHGADFRTFMFPGVLSMAVMFTAIFSAVSIVWDREFGFLREMLVAPVRRGAIVLGKCLGGATVATIQGVLILCLAGLVGIPYAPLLLLTLVGELLLLAFTLTAFGIMAAARIQQVESFQVMMQAVVLPMFFLSGAVFPLSNLPAWLQFLTRIDPLTYAVDPMRRAVFDRLSVSATTAHLLNPGVTWWGWHVPTWIELVLVAALGLVMLIIGGLEFSRTE